MQIIPKILPVLLIAVLLVSGCGMAGDPLGDVWSSDILPGSADTYTVGSEEYPYLEGWYTDGYFDIINAKSDNITFPDDVIMEEDLLVEGEVAIDGNLGLYSPDANFDNTTSDSPIFELMAHYWGYD